MVQYDKLVINKLLDNYESSLLSTGENERTIHIDVRFSKTFLPVYYDENSGEYDIIHIQMKQIESAGLICILWKDKKENHIIQKVRLNLQNLDKAYSYVKRTSKYELIHQNIEMLNSYYKQIDTMNLTVSKKFVGFLLDRLKENKTVKEYIELNDRSGSKLLLSAIQAVEQNVKPLYVREFSILNFRDSKVFEQLLTKVHHIFYRFDEYYKSKDMMEWLAEHNIYQTPNFVNIKGDIKIRLGEETMNLACFHHGLGVSGEDIDRIEILRNENVDKIITIENLTTYFRWQEKGSLIVYLGGYHNVVRRNLLKKIYKSFPEASYYHFGDIDAGGLEIYRDLRDKTGIPFKMYQMGLNVLKKYECYGKRLTQNDKTRLLNMQEFANEEVKELIAYMLQHDVKLEQECIGIDEECMTSL